MRDSADADGTQQEGRHMVAEALDLGTVVEVVAT